MSLPTQPTASPFCLEEHLERQRRFSEATFGPGARTAGVCDHIRKELREVQDDAAAGLPTLSEWTDVILLAFDGAWRSGASSQEIIAALVAKQTRNEGRRWPDWRTADPNKAIEHDRSGEGTAGPAAPGSDVAGSDVLRAAAPRPQAPCPRAACSCCCGASPPPAAGGCSDDGPDICCA